MQVVTYHYWQCELLWCLSAYKQHRHCWFLLVHNQRYCHFWESHSSDRECITYHAHPKTQTHIQITVWILLTLQLYTKHKCTHTLIQRLSTFVDTVHICRDLIRCNLWKVLIIGTANFNYLIRCNSWNEWIGINNILITRMGKFYSTQLYSLLLQCLSLMLPTSSL